MVNPEPGPAPIPRVGGSGDGAAARQSYNTQSHPAIERLVGRENWRTWKFAVRTYLEVEDLWDVVEPTPDADGAVPAVDAKKDRIARGKIILLIDPVNYIHVEEVRTAAEVWKKLKNTFEDTGLTRQWALLHKLITTNLTSCGSMEAYVNRMITTAHQLIGIGFPLDDKWIGMLLLAGLPQEYRPMVMGLENSGIEITGDIIKTKLLQETDFATPTAGPAFVSTKKNSNGRRGHHSNASANANSNASTSAKGKGPKCRRCEKFGHIAKNCQAREPVQRSGSDRNGDAFCTVLSVQDVAAERSWYFDSGSAKHLTNDERLLENVREAGGSIYAANKGVMKIVAEGSTKLQPTCNPDTIDVQNVELIPELAVNLLSVGKIVDQGHTVTFRKTGCEVVNPSGKVIATGCRANDLFKLEQKTSNVLACTPRSTAKLWHQRMGHLSSGSLAKLKNGLASGISYEGTDCGGCKICAVGKQTRLPFNHVGTRANEELELVHSDICGPMEETSLGGARFYLTFTDDKTRKIFVYFLRTKSQEEVLQKFKEFHTMAERQSGKKMKVLRTDNGWEFKNRSFENYLKQHGIRHQTSAEYTPEQNGLAERVNRTVVERARCMLYEARLPKSFWAEATAAAVYLINRSPTKGIDRTPEEAWTKRKPSLSHIRIFGTTVMAHVPKQKRQKWDQKAEECILTGYDDETKAYRLYNLKTGTIFRSRDVTFIDEGVIEREVVVSVKSGGPERSYVRLDFTMPAAGDAINPTEPENGDNNEPESDETGTSDDTSSSEEDSEDAAGNVTDPALPPRTVSNPPVSQALRQSGRERFLSGKYKDFHVETKGLPSSKFSDDRERCTIQLAPAVQESAAAAPPSSSNQRPPSDTAQGGLMLCDRGRPPQGKYLDNDDECSDTGADFPQFILDDPTTYQEALARDDAESWKQAMQEEYDALISNGTWTLTDLPKGRKAISCKWVYRTKLDGDGNIDRYKARLVIKGYSQRKGVDYQDTYAPVVRHSSLRYLFALAARWNLQIDQMDAITAFLQGELTEEIYMRQPPCFVDGQNQSKVCRLKKALYGLKQSSRVWNAKLDAALRKFGLKCTEYDPCVYYKISGDKVLFVAVYVDDFLIFTNCETWKKKLKEQLSKEFKMKDMGPAEHALGIRITKTDSIVALDQESYIEAVLSRFNMENCHPKNTPMNVSEKLTKDMCPSTDEETEAMKEVPYRQAVGCLMYLAQSTRPDICYAVNFLSRFNSNPGLKHWEAVKHLMRYLRGTSHYRLVYRRDEDSTIQGFSDADWAADVEDRKSTTGYVFTAQGGAISWCCKRQQTVALSTCEAEYMALSAAVQEALWWKRLRGLFEDEEQIVINCDNQSAIAVAKDGGYHPRTKHIDIRHHFIREAWARGDIRVEYVNTNQQTADGLTKPLPAAKLFPSRDAMGILKPLG